MAKWYYLSKAMKKETSTIIIIPEFQFKNQIFTNCKSDLDKICRVCLQTGAVNIYETEESDNIIDLLRSLTEKEIKKTNTRPKMLCSTCYKFLQNMISFREVAKKSEELLNMKQEENTNGEDLSDSDPCTSQTVIAKYSNMDHKQINQENEGIGDNNPKVTCHICQRVVTQSYFKEHVTMHDPDFKKFMCDICGKSFRLKCSFYTHSLRHRNDFRYKCSLCPYKGNYSQLLRVHMHKHTLDFRYLCTECPTRYRFKSNLDRHMLRHKEPQHKCDTCERTFYSKISLKRHFETTHLGLKKHVCNICGQAFGFRKTLRRHELRIHKREKSHYRRKPSYLLAEQMLETSILGS